MAQRFFTIVEGDLRVVLQRELLVFNLRKVGNHELLHVVELMVAHDAERHQVGGVVRVEVLEHVRANVLPV